MIEGALVQLHGVVGAPAFTCEADPSGGSSAGRLTFHKQVIEGALVQLYGSVGAPALTFNNRATLRLQDESKVRAALALVSSHDSKPIRLELSE